MMAKVLFTSLLLIFGTAAQACQFDTVTFDDDFPAARLDGCKQLSQSQYRLQINPENRPVNHSPWYAFKVESQKPQSINVEVVFDGNAPRYLPKVSLDGEHWRSIPFKIDEKVLSFTLSANKQTLWVAGQEIIDNQDYQQWIEAFDSDRVSKVTLGKSTQGRDIQALYAEQDTSKEWLVILGRQHPPEITGALALFPFIETLFKDSQKAKAFRQRFNLLIVPNLNPDGVAQGNWRHNINGIDLNRDWINFSQVETRLVRDAIEKIYQQGDKLVFALDFHSTQKDVFYTMPSDYPLAPSKLVEEWLGELSNVVRSNFTVRQTPGASPGRGVFKQYIADQYKVHAVTYEMGDNTNRELIKFVADKAAETMMDKLLKTPSADFNFVMPEAINEQ